MDEWFEGKLEDVCASIDYGLTASASGQPVGPKFLRITDIVGTSLNWNEVPFVLASKTNTEKFKLHDGDIVIARTGATTGESRFIIDPPNAVFASYLVRLKINQKNDPRFISYWLKSPAFRSYLQGVLGDKSAQPNASASTMTRAPIRLPANVEEQKFVSSILGTLDDKIELNRRMNETLEAMARAIFKDWFVDFGPTRAKAEGRAPYLPPELWDLFPDALDEEGKPVGWTSAPLDEIADFLNGLALQKFPASDPGDSLPVIKIAELRGGITPKSSRASREVPHKYVVRDGDFLFSWSGSLLAKFWTEGDGALNQHLFKVTSDRCPSWFFSQWVHHHLEEFRAIAASKATTMGHIQRRHLKEATTICPPDDVLPLLGQSVCPLVEHTIRNELENRTLVETRDLLLPKLMSGEIRLSEAEKTLEAAA